MCLIVSALSLQSDFKVIADGKNGVLLKTSQLGPFWLLSHFDSVLSVKPEMNPASPPTDYRYQPEREEEEDDTDLQSDIEPDAESEFNERFAAPRNARGSFTEMGNAVHTMDNVEIT